MKRFALLGLMATTTVVSSMAQKWHEGDIQWISSSNFVNNVTTWNSNYKLTPDDNFFISRVRPKVRFRNSATQVRENLKEGENDRRLIAWLPFNIHDGNVSAPDSRDALPSGVFDSECFTMWNYVDHWGDWTAPLGQIPGGLIDVAHKNGVGISSVASIPYGPITAEWKTALTNMGSQFNTDAGAQKVVNMLAYYGHDGIGYNSEFSSFTALNNLRTFHEKLLKGLNAKYNEVAPGYNMQENIWYDGTNDNGSIQFDAGLGSHNYRNWGPLGQERSSLFLNYNWVLSAGNATTLQKCVTNAASATYGKGRSPLYLYCGLNMQGGEPSPSRDPWNVFSKFNLSIGLWGQHKVNLFFEGRGSNGTSPDAQQTTYQSRIENWFTGGTHNPVNVPTTLSSSTTCNTDEKEFHGMSTFMSARSTLSWDLGKEAFVSYFNVGNGKFFNWKGERQHNAEWYNIASQDYMPTWRWWFNSKFLGKNAGDVAADGLKASITWKDAYIGGSTIRIAGSANEEYLHLFKTAYALKAGDVINFVYKLATGSTDASIVMSVNGAESTIAKEIPVCETSRLSDNSEWISKSYTVTEGDGLAGQTVAMIALKFNNAANMDMYLGEFSIKRAVTAAPVAPVIENVTVLRSHYAGVDAKVIFNVPNNKPQGTVCYNDDVNTSFFKIWSKEEGKEPVLLGTTTSWAAMAYSVPFAGDENGNGKISFGVEAVSMDHNSTSGIVWSDPVSSGTRAYSDQIQVSKTTITPGEEFTLSTVDAKRNFKWEVWTAGDNSTKVAESGDATNAWTCPGIEAKGTYDVKCIGANNSGADFILYKNLFVVTDPSLGRLPKIESLTANGSEASIEVVKGDDVTLQYTGRSANGVASRGIKIDEKFFGVKASEVFSGQYESFSLAGWLRIDNLPGDCVWIDVRNPMGAWPRNNWGWLWTNIKQDGTLMDFHHDLTVADAGAIQNPLVYDFNNGKTTFFNPGQWTHFAFTFDRDETKTRTIIYINGKKIESKWYYYTNTNDDFITDPNTTTKTPSQQGTTDDYVNAVKPMPMEAYLTIGGTRHTGRGGGLGFTGVLDDFQVWDHAMTQEEVNKSLAGLDGNNLPAGVSAYWDFEGAPNGENLFIAKGSKNGAKGGYFKLAGGKAEGEGNVTYQNPSFTSGCPFIPGVDYKIETKPSVEANKATISNVTGNDKAGSAKLQYTQPGEYTAVLTLTNDLGSDSKTFQFIKVGGDAAVDEIAQGELRTYTIDDTLYLEVVESGTYNVAIYALDGRTVTNATQTVASGDFMKVTVNGGRGIYVVKVTCDGKNVRNFKLNKK